MASATGAEAVKEHLVLGGVESPMRVAGAFPEDVDSSGAGDGEDPRPKATLVTLEIGDATGHFEKNVSEDVFGIVETGPGEKAQDLGRQPAVDLAPGVVVTDSCPAQKTGELSARPLWSHGLT